MKYCLCGVLIVAVAFEIHAQTADYEITRKFVSPSGAATAAVAVRRDLYGQIFSLGAVQGGLFQPFTDLPHPVYRREYHGSDWFETMPERWIGDRFLVFEDQFGIAIADVPSRRLLLDHVFETYAKNPTADEWAAIRFRPTTRAQEQLSEDFDDTLLFIDPVDAAAHVALATESDFTGHLKGIKPGGVMLAAPEWTLDGSSVSVLVWKQGRVSAIRYDRQLNETVRAAVDLNVDPPTALSTGINKQLAAVAKKILTDSTTFQSTVMSSSPTFTASPERRPQASATGPNASTRDPSPEVAQLSNRRNTITVAIILGLVLLLIPLFLYLRSR